MDSYLHIRTVFALGRMQIFFGGKYNFFPSFHSPRCAIETLTLWKKLGRCSLVVIVNRLPAGRPWFDSPPGRDLSLYSNVQNFSGSNPTSCLKRTEGSLPGVKQPGHEVEHSSPPSAEFKNAWGYTSAPLHAFLGYT